MYHMFSDGARPTVVLRKRSSLGAAMWPGVALAAACLLALAVTANSWATEDGAQAERTRTAHQFLRGLTGTWTARVSLGSEVSGGTWTTRSGPGGRWVVSDFSGELLGKPYEGHEVLGYDSASDTFIAIWVDSFARQPWTLSGRLDEAKGRMTWTRSARNREGRAYTATTLVEYVGEDHMIATSYEEDGESIGMVMELRRRETPPSSQ